MKRILSYIICLTLLVTSVSAPSYAYDTENIVSDYSEYEYDNTSEVETEILTGEEDDSESSPSGSVEEDTSAAENEDNKADAPDSEETENAESDASEAEDFEDEAQSSDEIPEAENPAEETPVSEDIPETEGELLGEPPLGYYSDYENYSAQNIVNGVTPLGTGIGVSARTIEEIEAYLLSHPANPADPVTYAVKPVVSGAVNPGQLSDTTLISALNMMNRVRFIAGLNEVTINSEYSKASQAGVLSNYMNGALSHTPSQPAGMPDDLYTLAQIGCISSNLAWSSSSSYTMNQTILNLWMGDSDNSNIDRLGHRRWMLNPRMSETGFGAVSGGRGIYLAVYANDMHSSDTRVGVAWPAQVMPTGYFGANDAWSYSAGVNVDKASTEVVLTREKDQKVWKFSSSASNGYFNVDNVAYGQTGCIIFRPSGISSYNNGDVFDVNITFTSKGVQKNVSYKVSFFAPNQYSTITYVLGGTADYPATNSPNNPATIRATDEVVLEDAERFGYEFDGWYKDSAFRSRITAIPKGTASNLTLYAKWVKVPTKLAEGSCGTDLHWEYIDTGVLTVTGFGDMDLSTCPWDTYKSKITDIELPSGLSKLDGRLFIGLNNLKSFTIPDENPHFFVFDGIVFSKDKTKVFAVSELISEEYIVLDKKVTAVDSNAFAALPNITVYCYTPELLAILGALNVNCKIFATYTTENPKIQVILDGEVTDSPVISEASLLYLTTDTDGATIYYTTDGSTPIIPAIDVNGRFEEPVLPTRKYTDRITISDLDINTADAVAGEVLGSVTINAVAAKEKYTESGAVSFSYKIVDESNTWGQIIDDDKPEYPVSEIDNELLWVSGITDVDYNGTNITFPNLNVYKNKTKLVSGKDYTVKYVNNKNVGTGKVIITGRGDYSGSIEKTFAINPLDITQATITPDPILFTYNGRVQKGIASVAYILSGKTVTLKAGVDFTYVYPGTDPKGPGYDASAFKGSPDTETNYTIDIVGKGNYTGTVHIVETITPKTLIDKAAVTAIKAQTYTGSAIEPAISLTYNKKPLELNADYEILGYSDNVEVGTGKIRIRGIGDSFTGERVITFKISELGIIGRAVFGPEITKTYAWNAILPIGSAVEPVIADKAAASPSVKFVINKQNVFLNGILKSDYDAMAYDNPLRKNYDYTYEYVGDNKNIGSVKINFYGINGYTGTATKTFKISGFDVRSVKINNLKTTYTWTDYAGASVDPFAEGVTITNVEERNQPAVTLNGTTKAAYEALSDSDKLNYSFYYEYQGDRTKIGTVKIVITGVNGYTGTQTKSFNIDGKTISKVAVTTAVAASYPYDGAAREPHRESGFKVYEKATKTTGEYVLIEGTDYEITYTNNINAGRATMTITGINKYSGTIVKTFTITPYNIAATKNAAGEAIINNVSIAPIAGQEFLKGGVKPEITVNDSHLGVLVLGKDYTVSYSNNIKVHDGTPGKTAPTVTVVGKGNYTGRITANFAIIKKAITKAGITVTAGDVVYQNKTNICKPVIKLVDEDGKIMTAGVDYDNIFAYSYTKDVIVSKLIDAKKNVYKFVIRMAGDAVNPDDIIPVGAEITVTINEKAGTGSYTGTTSATFKFIAADISKAAITVAPQSYTGKPVSLSKSDIAAKIGNVTLDSNDYTIIGYAKNIATGSATVTIKGIGNYGGVKTVPFKIVAKSMNYTVKYIKNSEEATGIMKDSVTAANGKVTANAYKRNGYSFAGWSTTPGQQTVEINNAGQLSLSGVNVYGSTIYLYAQWTPIVYTITYSLNGGTNNPGNPSTYTILDSVVLANPVKEGYTFGGWYLDSRFSAANRVTDISAGTTGNKVLYAKWIK